jgi:outer membrane immunogenic protein
MTRKLASLLLVSAAAVATPSALSAQDWTGFYVGVNAGAGTSNLTWSNLVVPSTPDAGLPNAHGIINPSNSGFEGGAQAGYNEQMGPWVWGVEASFDGGDLGGSQACFGGYGDYHATCGSRTSWKLDFTGRVGGTVGPALLYVKGGVELADETTSAKNIAEGGGPNEGSFKSASNTPFGYVFGIGAEVAFTDDVSGAIEYDYSSVNYTAHMNPTAALISNAAFLALPFTVKVAHQENIVTARLNFKCD